MVVSFTSLSPVRNIISSRSVPDHLQPSRCFWADILHTALEGSSPAPSFGLTHGQRAIQAHYLVVVAGECYTICKIVLPIKYLINHPLAEAFPVEALEHLSHSQVSLCSPYYPN